MLLAVNIRSLNERLVPGRADDSVGVVDPVRERRQDSDETFVISSSNRVNYLVALYPLVVCFVEVFQQCRLPPIHLRAPNHPFDVCH